MLYIDANVFIYAIAYDGEKSRKAEAVLDSIVSGKEAGITASLSLDEILWKVLKLATRERALAVAKKILELPNLKLAPIGRPELDRALALMGDYPTLKPRDAIHAATAINVGARLIVSDDSDFDTLKELKRKGL